MYEDLEPEEFKELLESTNDAILIDVRTPDEEAENSIEGHILINAFSPNFPDKIMELDKDKSYFMYCRSGNRSGKACAFMANNGFSKLFNLKGGMLAWEIYY
ncbi:MAG: rhodanese-like domain-containing protein [Bacteroidetes bacterium]|jgi:rhodanese-related sulfurtransferase|nr:rhodanese-like domain-containing protein [Bacteroidota bacterium]MBP7255757.1 rhodanese-like domain-containing protein [Chitinophagales bacterium]MBK7138250.1 rhodanese-like domain-containing protein [Bacteroidota bacterium]MBK7504130.1 rhodanese-like domain-containing protein [Bacteroidota bacterium]MBK7641207.1 rhodanese-like domain-containing protein [Bacteroidota bacterium]